MHLGEGVDVGEERCEPVLIEEVDALLGGSLVLEKLL